MMFWKYFGVVVILFKYSEQSLGNDSYEIYVEAVTWSQALQNCEKHSSKLVSYNPVPMYHVRNISSLKREIHHYLNATSSWVGDYISYAVVNDQQIHLSEGYTCVELRVTTNTSLNATRDIYEYLLFPANCTNSNIIICEENTTGFNITNDKEPWPGSCHTRKLWMPPFTPYLVALDGAVGFGNYTTVEELASGETYWTGYRLTQFRSEIPVRGNILRCGYISLRETSILYDECIANKSYVCERTTESALGNATSSPGLYAGICLAVAVVITLTVTVIIWLRRKKLSKCKLLKTTKEGKNLFRSWSSESQKSSVGLVLENNNPTFETSEELQGENTIVAENPIYALPFKNSNHLHTSQSEPITHPVVAPQNTTDDNSRSNLQTRYLTMNGSSTENKHASQTNNTYDFIESYRSTNSSRYKDLTTSVNDTGNNAYGMVAVSKDSVYDLTNTFRSNENKGKVTETSYNHVAIDIPGAKTEKESGNTTYGMLARSKESIYDHTSSLRGNKNKGKVTKTSYDLVAIDNLGAKTEKESEAFKEKTRPVQAPRTSVNSDIIYDDILT